MDNSEENSPASGADQDQKADSTASKLSKSFQGSMELAGKQTQLKKLELTDLREVRARKGTAAFKSGIDEKKCSQLYSLIRANEDEISAHSEDAGVDEQATATDKMKHAAGRASARTKIEVLRAKRKKLLIQLGSEVAPERGIDADFDAHLDKEIALLEQIEKLRSEVDTLKSNLSPIAGHPFLVGGAALLVLLLLFAVGNSWWKSRNDPAAIAVRQMKELLEIQEQQREDAKQERAEAKLQREQADQQKAAATSPVPTRPVVAPPVRQEEAVPTEDPGPPGTARHALVLYLNAIRDGKFDTAANYSTPESAAAIAGYQEKASSSASRWQKDRHFAIQSIDRLEPLTTARLNLGRFNSSATLRLAKTEDGWKVHDSTNPWFLSKFSLLPRVAPFEHPFRPVHHVGLTDGRQFLYEDGGKGQVLTSKDGYQWQGYQTDLPSRAFAVFAWKAGLAALAPHPSSEYPLLLTSSDGTAWRAVNDDSGNEEQQSKFEGFFEEFATAEDQIYLRAKMKPDSQWPSGSFAVLSSSDGVDWKVMWQGSEEGKLSLVTGRPALLTRGGFLLLEKDGVQAVQVNDYRNIPDEVRKIGDRWLALFGASVYESSDLEKWTAFRLNSLSSNGNRLFDVAGVPVAVSTSGAMSSSEFPGEWKPFKIAEGGKTLALPNDHLIVFDHDTATLLRPPTAESTAGGEFSVTPLQWGDMPSFSLSEAGSGRSLSYSRDEPFGTMTPKSGGIPLPIPSKSSSAAVGPYRVSINLPGYHEYSAEVFITTESQRIDYQLQPEGFDLDDLLLTNGNLRRASDGQLLFGNFARSGTSKAQAQLNLKSGPILLVMDNPEAGAEAGQVKFLRLDPSNENTNVTPLSGAGQQIEWPENTPRQFLVSPDLKRAVYMQDTALQIAMIDWSKPALVSAKTLDGQFQYPSLRGSPIVWGDDEIIFMDSGSLKRVDLNTGQLTVNAYFDQAKSSSISWRRHHTDKHQLVGTGYVYPSAGQRRDFIAFFNARDLQLHLNDVDAGSAIKDFPGYRLRGISPRTNAKGATGVAYRLDGDTFSPIAAGGYQVAEMDYFSSGLPLSPDGQRYMYLRVQDGRHAVVVGKTDAPEFQRFPLPKVKGNVETGWLANNWIVVNCQYAEDPNDLGIYLIDPATGTTTRLSRFAMPSIRSNIAWVKKDNSVIFNTKSANTEQTWRTNLKDNTTVPWTFPDAGKYSLRLESIEFQKLSDWQSTFKPADPAG